MTDAELEESPVSANKREYDRLVAVGEGLGERLIAITSCDDIDELEMLYHDILDYVKHENIHVSDITSIILDGLRGYDSAQGLEAKRNLLMSSIREAKDWLYDLKRRYGAASDNNHKLETAGFFTYDGVDFYYKMTRIDVPNQSGRLLLAFMRADNFFLTKSQIERLDGEYVADSATNRVDILRRYLSKTEARRTAIERHGLADGYRLKVD